MVSMRRACKLYPSRWLSASRLVNSRVVDRSRSPSGWPSRPYIRPQLGRPSGPWDAVSIAQQAHAKMYSKSAPRFKHTLAAYLFVLGYMCSPFCLAYVAMEMNSLELSFELDPIDAYYKWYHRERLSTGARKITSTIYRRLKRDQIRLLLLAPGREGDVLEMCLIHHDVQRHARYEALSYVWGDDKLTHPCVQDGCVTYITEGLADALHALRLHDRPRLLWVDAVSIDQKDELEKQEQVRIMPSIYSRATRVIVWLGNHPSEGQQVSSWGEDIFLVSRRASQWDEAPGYRFSTPTNTTDESYDLPLDWSLLNRFLELPWFSRAWVLQEVVYGRQVFMLCGGKYLSWRQFLRCVQKINSDGRSLELLSSDAQRAVKHVVAMGTAAESSSRRRSLLSVLLETNSTRCSDPRDKIYAVLSLSREAGEFSVFRPDYSISCAEVYEQYAALLIETSGQPNVLCCTSPRSSAPTPSPSWATDWTQLENDELFINAEKLPFHADGQIKPVQVVLENHRLHFEATRVDTLDAVFGPSAFKKTPLHSESLVWEDFMNSARWLLDCLKVAEGSHQANEMWRVMLCDLTGQAETPSVERAQSFRWYLYMIQTIHAYGAEHGPLPDSELQRYLSIYQHTIVLIESSLYRWASRRQFARTASGRLAFVPKEAQPGDVVFTVGGLPVPLILRPEQHGTFSSVGEAYVHGIMYGEDMLIAPRSRAEMIIVK